MTGGLLAWHNVSRGVSPGIKRYVSAIAVLRKLFGVPGRRLLTVMAAAVLLGACTGQDPATTGRGVTSSTPSAGASGQTSAVATGAATPTRSFDPVDALDNRPTGPLPEFGACEGAPPPGPDQEVEGLVLPEGSVITDVAVVDPVTTVMGYTGLTPSQFRRTYQRRGDVEIVAVEDDTFDTEVTFVAGDHRTFVRATAVCDRGVRFAALITPERSTTG